MKKMLYYVITVAVIIALGAVCIVFANDDDSKNIKFLNSYGWEVKPESIENEQIIIPEVFDDIYNNYNTLQKISGLDLEQYKGKKAIRYTYIVSNFPYDVDDEQVRANVLCVNREPVAGDIMTVRSDGFMFSLSYLKTGR